MTLGLNNPVARAAGLIELGGPVVALLLALSVVALAIVIYKVAQYARLGTGRDRHVDDAVHLWRSGDRAAARARLTARTTALAGLVRDAMGKCSQAGSEDRPDLEDHFSIEAAQQLQRLQSGFRALESIAQIAPLIGLFGTVLGMIEAFRQLQSAGNSVDPSLLAGGIWVALLTTAVGLAVAMPTAICLSVFESRVARHRLAVEVALTGVFNPVQPDATTAGRAVEQPMAAVAAHAR